jgi:hypothetical protein
MEAKGDIPSREETSEKLRCLQEIGPSLANIGQF